MLIELKKDIQSEIVEYIDVNVYDCESWKKRNESIGYSSVCTLVAEGKLNHILNGYIKPSGKDLTLEILQKIAKKHGCYVEQGYAWSWHFYPIKD